MRPEFGDLTKSDEAHERLDAALSKIKLEHRQVDGVPQWVITGSDQRGLVAILSAANAVRVSYRIQIVGIEKDGADD